VCKSCGKTESGDRALVRYHFQISWNLRCLTLYDAIVIVMSYHHWQPSRISCGRCHKVYYCSRDCQRQDWGRHKPECSSSDSAAAPKKTPPPEPLPGTCSSRSLSQLLWPMLTTLPPSTRVLWGNVTV
jgi:hypothetical protein